MFLVRAILQRSMKATMSLQIDSDAQWHPFEAVKFGNTNHEIIQVLVTSSFVQVINCFGTVDEFRFGPPRQRTLFNVPDGTEREASPRVSGDDFAFARELFNRTRYGTETDVSMAAHGRALLGEIDRLRCALAAKTDFATAMSTEVSEQRKLVAEGPRVSEEAREPQEWRWFGKAAHFICGSLCRFHLATKVGDYLVSTVGEYVPTESVQTIHAEVRGNPLTQRGDAREAEYLEKFGFEPLGAWGTYETLVFHATKYCDGPKCGCGTPIPDDWGELDGERYDNAKDATAGHYAYCEKVARGEIKRAGETNDDSALAMKPEKEQQK